MQPINSSMVERCLLLDNLEREVCGAL